MKNRVKEQRGAAVVEFAVILVVILVLLAGILEFGFLWLQNNYIANAAREGARVAARIGSDPDAVADAVRDYLRGLYPDDMVDDEFCQAVDPSGCGTEDFITLIYDPGAIETVDAAGTPVYMARVTVTVQTAMIWEPLLWDVINFVPWRDPDAPPAADLTEVSETAAFPREDQTPPPAP